MASLLAACGAADDNSRTADATVTAVQATSAAHGRPVIAYQTLGGGSEGIWLVGLDGTGKRQVATDAAEQQLLPDWSSDGRRIVFTARGGETEPLYVYDLATEKSTQLFECSLPCFGDDEPAFSPDGSQVAFLRALGPPVDDKPSDCGLWIGTVATGAVRRVTSHKLCDPRETNPRWSPDGKRLTYWTEQYSPAGEVTGTAVFVMDVDGRNVKQLTDWKDNAGESDWSPDGMWIVYATHPLRNFQCCEVSNLHRVHPDGTGREALTTYTTDDTRATQPRYTPDGKQILFTLVTGSRDLAFLPAAGGPVRKVTSGGIHTHGDLQPASADG